VVAGSEMVVTVGTALMGSVNVFVPDEDRLSVALIVNWNDPADGGVPPSTAPFSVNHEGSVWLASAKV
jgi:hypothetical protein